MSSDPQETIERLYATKDGIEGFINHVKKYGAGSACKYAGVSTLLFAGGTVIHGAFLAATHITISNAIIAQSVASGMAAWEGGALATAAANTAAHASAAAAASMTTTHAAGTVLTVAGQASSGAAGIGPLVATLFTPPVAATIGIGLLAGGFWLSHRQKNQVINVLCSPSEAREIGLSAKELAQHPVGSPILVQRPRKDFPKNILKKLVKIKNPSKN